VAEPSERHRGGRPDLGRWVVEQRLDRGRVLLPADRAEQPCHPHADDGLGVVDARGRRAGEIGVGDPRRHLQDDRQRLRARALDRAGERGHRAAPHPDQRVHRGHARERLRVGQQPQQRVGKRLEGMPRSPLGRRRADLQPRVLQQRRDRRLAAPQPREHPHRVRPPPP
jgi:hypothetical protein